MMSKRFTKLLAIFLLLVIANGSVSTRISDFKKYGKMNCLLVIDTSLSMKKYFNDVKNSIISFVDSLNYGDVVTVITFDTYVEHYLAPTIIKDSYWKEEIKEKLARLYAKGDYTYLAFALKESRKLMRNLEKKFPYHRSVILLFSDNRDDPPPWARGKTRVNLKQEAIKFRQMRGWMVFTISAVRKRYKKGADVASMIGGTFIPYKSKGLLKFNLKFINIFMRVLPFLEIILTFIIIGWILSKKKFSAPFLDFLVIIGFISALLIYPEQTLKYMHYFYGFIWQIITFITNYFIKTFIFNKIRFVTLIIGIIILIYYRKKLKIVKESIKTELKFLKLKEKEEIITFLKENQKDKKLIKYLGKIKDWKTLLSLYGKKDKFKKLVQKQLKKIKNRKQYILLAGPFSSGKSFFLKALTDLKIFESKSVPTTHILHYLSYGKNRIEMYYKSGKIETIKIDDIDYDFIEKNKYLLDKIKIFTKNKIISKKLVFIDTPGVEDIEETFKFDKHFIELMDIILYFIDALKPLADYDKKNIRKLLKFNKRIIFVVTKIDMLDEYENNISEIGRFLYTNIEKHTKIKNPEIVFISSKYYIKGKKSKDKFLIFESNLSAFLKYLNS